MNRSWVIILLLHLSLLTACEKKRPSLYQWEDYPQQVYDYLNGGSQEKQIIELEKGLEKIKSAHKSPPPGYYHHLGLLYGQAGQTDKMIQAFEEEKRLFPESSAYINFLLRKYRAVKTGSGVSSS